MFIFLAKTWYWWVLASFLSLIPAAFFMFRGLARTVVGEAPQALGEMVSGLFSGFTGDAPEEGEEAETGESESDRGWGFVATLIVGGFFGFLRGVATLFLGLAKNSWPFLLFGVINLACGAMAIVGFIAALVRAVAG